MLEVKYFRDYKHSYMILQCTEDANKSYQGRLLTSGRIGEVLRCSLRHVNGMTFYYYDISSRTTLESLYRSRKLTFTQVRELFGQLYAIYCSLGNNFMEESRLVLLPEFIFYDFSRKKYIGLYYPDYEEDKPYGALMDFLLEHIDGQDERLTECMYQIYELAEDSEFSIWDALQIMGKAEESDREAGKEEKSLIEREGEMTFMSEKPVSQEEKIMTFEDPGENFDLWEEREKAPAKRKSAFSPFLMLLSVLGILGIGYVYVSFELSEEEIMILFSCAVLMGICFLAGLLGTCGGRKTKEKGETKKESETFLPQEEVFSSSAEIVSLEQVIKKDAEPQPVMFRKETGEDFFGKTEECGNTVFFDSMKLAEHKLYALGKKNKNHIKLTKFPFTVGKMAGCVECVLMDDSISRIHARFEKVGDTIQMTDMNSTNGTYKNGLRLQPHETVEIEPGDEIRFGNLNYCYR